MQPGMPALWPIATRNNKPNVRPVPWPNVRRAPWIISSHTGMQTKATLHPVPSAAWHRTYTLTTHLRGRDGLLHQSRVHIEQSAGPHMDHQRLQAHVPAGIWVGLPLSCQSPLIAATNHAPCNHLTCGYNEPCTMLSLDSWLQ